ncbi:DUF4422 domain-containing protein [Campylobacter jejuni]|nr:DUF4422 domain-containing protein [Campylobacter jejuni]
MQNRNTIKILVGYHKPGVLLKDEIFTPIHLGRVLATEFSKDGEISREDFEWMCENMIGDDTGENISCLNRYFNELTGIYWAWKNYEKLGNPDYIGFVHYRRHFIFDQNIKLGSLKKHWTGYSYLFQYFNDDYKNIINPKLLDNITLYDIIAPQKLTFEQDVVWTNKKVKMLKECFLSYNEDDSILEEIQKLIYDLKPEYKDLALHFKEQLFYHPANMFIMKRELFFEMCNFVFTISLPLYDKLKDRLENGILWSRRYLAWGTEYLISLFIQKKDLENKKIKEFPISFIDDTSNIDGIRCEIDSFTVVFSANNDEIYSLAVSIQSLISNINAKNNYQIYILYQELSHVFQKKLKYLVQEFHNVSIFFIDIGCYINHFDILQWKNQFATSDYSKLLIPHIFHHFSYVVYCSCEMIFFDDISKIFLNTNMDFSIGAVRHVKAIDTFFREKVWSQDKSKYQIDKEEQVVKLFSTNILLYDISKAFNKLNINIFYSLYNQINKDDIYKCSYFDFIFNKIFENDVMYLDLSWSLDWYISSYLGDIYGLFLPNQLAIKYYESNVKFNAIYFNGNEKPWIAPHILKADIWWYYARKTSIYEEMICSFGNRNDRNNILNGSSERVKNYLAYQLGNELLKTIKGKNILKVLLPFKLLIIIRRYKYNHKVFNAITQVNPNLALPDIEKYGDYEEAIKIKRHLSYRLGVALVKHPFTFVFKASDIYRQWSKGE